MGFREENVDFVDRVFLAPAVFDRRYSMLMRIGFEVERREVPLDEAGTGDERAWRVIEVHVLGPELRELRIDEALPVEAVELDVHLAFFNDGFPGFVLADEVDWLLREVPLEILDDAAARRAHPKDGRECERKIRTVFGEDELGCFLIQAAIDRFDESFVIFLAHERRGVAADLPGTGAQIDVTVSVERESVGAEFVEVRLLPID